MPSGLGKSSKGRGKSLQGKIDFRLPKESRDAKANTSMEDTSNAEDAGLNHTPIFEATSDLKANFLK